jgi:hypothetical protein
VVVSSEPNMVSYMRTVYDCLKQRDVSGALSWATTALRESGEPTRGNRPVHPDHVGGQTPDATPVLNENFVRGPVPAGPYKARMAWARAMGNACTVLAVDERKRSGLHVAYAVLNEDGTINGRNPASSASLDEFLRIWRRP